MDILAQLSSISSVTFKEFSGLVIALLALIVSLLTLYNAARLKTGILAVSTYAFGAGMLSLAAGFFLLTIPAWAFDQATVDPIYRALFIIGFVLLGFGSYQIYKMSKV